MDKLSVFEKMQEIAEVAPIQSIFDGDSEQDRKIAEHKIWLQSIRRERPSPDVPFKVGIYIRYFNQTKYENYLSYHKRQFQSTMELCPLWELVDFYVDEGASAPNMETAPEWSRLLDDCMDGRVNLIITQKVSNVSRKMHEVILCSRLLAAQPNPVGIYFISEDIFTLASYYQADLRDQQFLPEAMKPLDEPDNVRGLLND